MNNNIIKRSAIFGLFTLAVIALTDKKLNPIGDVSNELDINRVDDNNGLVVACRRQSSKTNIYPDTHKIALSVKQGDNLTIFSQEYIKKTFEQSKYDVEIINDNGYVFGLAVITKKPEKKTPAKSEPPVETVKTK